MKKILFFIAILFFCLTNSCRKEENPVSVQNGTSNDLLPSKTISGKVVFPNGSPVQYTNLKVMGFDESSVGSNGEFNVEVADKFYGFLDVKDNSGKIVAMAYDSLYNGILVNENSTAVSLVLCVPVSWDSYSNRKISQLINSIKSHQKYNQLVTYTRSIMLNDPYNLTNFNSHPSMLEIIKEIVLSLKASDEKSGFGGAELIQSSCSDPDKIVVRNPKNIPYGISGFDLNKDPKNINNYFFSKTPRWIESKGMFGWIQLPPLFGLPEREYNLGKGNYFLCLGKPDLEWLNTSISSGPLSVAVIKSMLISNQLSQGNYVEVSKIDARLKASCAYVMDLVLNGIGLIPESGDVFEITGSIIMELINSGDLEEIVFSGFEPSVFKLVNDAIERIKDNDALTRKIAKILKVKPKFLTDKLIKLLIIPNILDIAISLFDLYTADQEIIYTIRKEDNPALNSCIKSSPPSIPVLSGYPSFISLGNSANITAVSNDPENKQVRYHLLKNSSEIEISSWKNSGTSHIFNFTPNTTGQFNLMIWSEDIDGAMSGPAKFLINVTSGQSFFSEGYESYSLGRFSTNSIWTVDYQLPSEVRILNVPNSGVQSAMFMDYDPVIGNQSGYYAITRTSINGNPNTIEFYMRVDYQDDDFGVRAWQNYGYWNSMAYYICIMDGNIKWVKNGVNMNDPNDFIAIQNANPQSWYKIKLLVNWTNSTYNIYINNVLKVSNATFVSTYYGTSVHSAPIFQALAFTDTKCRCAYLDDIVIQGGSFSKIPENLISNDFDATKISSGLSK